MTNFNKNQVLALLVWKATEGQGNWGGWGNYPTLPVGAKYLQYDTNQCQINLDKPVTIDGEQYNCITDGRAVGAKWHSPISFTELQNSFGISNDEIKIEIANKNNAKQRSLIERSLNHARRMLLNDDYKPTVCPIEQIHLRSERSGDNYTTPLFTVHFSGGDIDNRTLTIAEDVEWKQLRLQGKNGQTKKRVFVPVSISAHAQQLIDTRLAELKARRIQHLQNEISNYETQLGQLI